MYRVFLIAVIINGALGQLARNGTCGNIQGVVININQFAGTWYQTERIANPDEIGDCSTSTYHTNWTMVNREVLNRQVWTRQGQIINSAANATGKLEIRFSDNTRYDYYVLTTDNTNFALMYSCRDTSNTTSQVWAWKLSRNTTMSTTGAQVMNAVIQAHNHLRTASFRLTSHSADACRGGVASLVASPMLAVTGLYLILYMSKEFGLK